MDEKTLVVHGGGFHADDVFASAVFVLVYGDGLKIVRSRDKSVIEKADFVADVGGIYDASIGRFDHHQSGGAGSRANGVSYASFGLVWKQFGEQLSGSRDIAEIIDKKLVQFIDAGDNGMGEIKPFVEDIYPYTINHIFWSMEPTWVEGSTEINKRFFEAVELAKGILQREIKIIKDDIEGEKQVDLAYKNSEDKRIIVLEKKYPWRDALSKYKEPIFAVYPDEASSNWDVSAVRDNPKKFANRKDFPIEWAGKSGEELSLVSGVSDAVFCHNRRFFAVAKSKEGAISLARKALES